MLLFIRAPCLSVFLSTYWCIAIIHRVSLKTGSFVTVSYLCFDSNELQNCMKMSRSIDVACCAYGNWRNICDSLTITSQYRYNEMTENFKYIM